MPDDERLRLQVIAERIARVRSWVEEMDEAQFLIDFMVRDAVAMSLLVIGETSRRLLDSTKTLAPEIPWSAVISLRNRIAHGYETVDHALVWQIVNHDLPEVATALRRLLDQEV